MGYCHFVRLIFKEFGLYHSGSLSKGKVHPGELTFQLVLCMGHQLDIVVFLEITHFNFSHR